MTETPGAIETVKCQHPDFDMAPLVAEIKPKRTRDGGEMSPRTCIHCGALLWKKHMAPRRIKPPKGERRE